jgi:NAD(P)-dependent dehydrogenase (short-subunit alcohol dehydrogenase family)
MRPVPEGDAAGYVGMNRLRGKTVLISGGDSGIGRAVAVACAKEGADVAILYLEEGSDARKTKSLVEEAGRKCLTFAGERWNGRSRRSVRSTC